MCFIFHVVFTFGDLTSMSATQGMQNILIFSFNNLINGGFKFSKMVLFFLQVHFKVLLCLKRLSSICYWMISL